MSTLSQFAGGGGGVVPNGILNGVSELKQANGVSYGLTNGAYCVLRRVLSGALTAATLSTVLSLSGKGTITNLVLGNMDTTNRTHRVKVTLDGIVIFDATSSPVATPANFYNVIGHYLITSPDGTTEVTFEPLNFDHSLLIEYASSLTETGMTAIAYRYYPRA